MPDDTVNGPPGEPFNILFNPDVQRTALARQQGAAESGPQTGNVVGLNNDDPVGPVGLEPTTYGLKVRSSAIELEARSTTLCDAWRRSQG